MGNCLCIEKIEPRSEEVSSKQVKVRFKEPEIKHTANTYEEYLFKLQRSRTGAHQNVCT